MTQRTGSGNDKAQPGVTSTGLQVHERGGADMAAKRAERMLQIEDEILQACYQITQAHLAYVEVSPTEENPPESWVQQHGLENAMKRLDVAKSGWLPTSKEPSGSVAARQIMVGIAKARGQKASIRVPEVNVKIALPAPTSASFPSQAEGQVQQYPSRVLDE